MKRIICIALALFLLLSVVSGCKKNTDDNNSSEISAVSESVTEINGDNEAQTAETESAAESVSVSRGTGAEGASVPTVTVDAHTWGELLEDGGKASSNGAVSEDTASGSSVSSGSESGSGSTLTGAIDTDTENYPKLK